MNAPGRSELFVLDDGEKSCVTFHLESRHIKTDIPFASSSVEIVEDTKIPNAAHN